MFVNYSTSQWDSLKCLIVGFSKINTQGRPKKSENIPIDLSKDLHIMYRSYFSTISFSSFLQSLLSWKPIKNKTIQSRIILAICRKDMLRITKQMYVHSKKCNPQLVEIISGGEFPILRRHSLWTGLSWVINGWWHRNQ